MEEVGSLQFTVDRSSVVGTRGDFGRAEFPKWPGEDAGKKADGTPKRAAETAALQNGGVDPPPQRQEESKPGAGFVFGVIHRRNVVGAQRARKTGHYKEKQEDRRKVERQKKGRMAMTPFSSWFQKATQGRQVELRNPSRILASTEFAFRLFRELKPGDRNLAICPYGVRVALSMLWRGATGETRRQLEQVLGLDENSESTANHYEKLGRPMGFQTGAEGRGLELLTANALWCDQGFTPKEEYAAKLRLEYQAEVQALDFGSADSAGIVNRWANEKTRGRIPTVVGSLNALSPMMLMNAVYFKGLWANAFEIALTKKEEFTLLDGTKIMVPLMRQSGEFPYAERDGTQFVSLVYKGWMGMCVALPPKGMDFRKFCAELKNTVGTEWTCGMDRREGHVRLPRFCMQTSTSFSEPLRAMGIQQAFDPGRAGLEGINDGKSLFLAGVQQTDFVEVNEKGTEAAAVTMCELASGMVEPPPPPPPFEMIVDRPFVFAICDNLSGAVVFLGAVVDPTEMG